jgi:hypothetical protein
VLGGSVIWEAGVAGGYRMIAGGLALLVAVVALVQTGNSNWLIAVGIGVFVLATGRAVFRGYARTKGPTGPPTDVDEPDTLLVFACETCGEQLILLRKGTDAPPRHCADPMVLRRVPAPSERPGGTYN